MQIPLSSPEDANANRLRGAIGAVAYDMSVSRVADESSCDRCSMFVDLSKGGVTFS
jgi:hypothetical protein